MGIDPVTHAPRLDLLEISSILRSALSLTTTSTPPSLLNLQALMMNPELLKLITTLLSLKNHHQNQNYQDLVSLSSHNNNNLIQQIQAAAGDNINYQVQSSHTTHQVDPQIMPMNNIMMSDEFDHQTTNNNMSYCTSSSLDNNNVDIPSLSSYLWENQNLNGQQEVDLPTLMDDNEKVQSVGYNESVSVLSTPLSSPTPLNSSGTEEERDSHCSDLFKFHIPEITDLDINDFL